MGDLEIRQARLEDAAEIQQLVAENARQRLMLPRAIAELYENIRDFFVAREAGAFRGAAALHVVWSDLAEVKSLAVQAEARGRGIGRRLVAACLEEARRLGIKRVFALTYQGDFFRRLDFKPIDKSDLPHKIWSECLRCPEFPECGEEAFVRELATEEK